MSVNIGTANISKIRLTESVSPTTPGSGYGYLYAKTDGLYFKGDGGTEIGPLGGGRILIETKTPAGGTTATFSSIPATFKDLEIVLIGKLTAAVTAGSFSIRFNSDTTDANYRSAVGAIQAAGATNFYGGDYSSAIQLSAGSSPSNSAGIAKIWIPSYAGTTFNKLAMGTWTIRRDASSVYQMSTHFGLEWENTTAISRIDLIVDSGGGNFATGTEVRLYGYY